MSPPLQGNLCDEVTIDSCPPAKRSVKVVHVKFQACRHAYAIATQYKKLQIVQLLSLLPSPLLQSHVLGSTRVARTWRVSLSITPRVSSVIELSWS